MDLLVGLPGRKRRGDGGKGEEKGWEGTERGGVYGVFVSTPQGNSKRPGAKMRSRDTVAGCYRGNMLLGANSACLYRHTVYIGRAS